METEKPAALMDARDADNKEQRGIERWVRYAAQA
jgi:hypothetical protein